MKSRVKFFICLFVISISFGSVFAQKSVFSQLLYEPPKNMPIKQKDNNKISFEIVEGYKFCQISLWSMTDSKGSHEVNFKNDWETLISKDLNVGKIIQTDNFSKDGWQVTKRTAEATFQNAPLKVLVITFTKGKLFFSISANFNHDSYFSVVNNFIDKIEVINDTKTSIQTASTIAPTSTNHNTGISLSTTNFDDGWVATITSNYVQVSRNGIEVRLYYPDENVDKNRNRGDGTPFEYHYWDIWVKPDFQANQIGERKHEIGMSPILEAQVTNLKTGQQGFASLKLYFNNGVCTPIVIFAPSKQQLYQTFPDHNDFDKMLEYNKFAVSAQDIVGEWKGGGSSAMNYYSIYSGQYVGTNISALSDNFTFNKNGTYQSKHNFYSSGSGGGKQEYQGSYQVNTWTMILKNRFKNGTEEMWCSFEAVKGGRILYLTNKQYTGQRYVLLKAK